MFDQGPQCGDGLIDGSGAQTRCGVGGDADGQRIEMRGSEWAGEYIAHQAVAYLQTGDAEAACAAITEAADAAHATSSAALFRKLKSIHTKMRAKSPDNPAVTELRDVLC